MRWVLLVGLLAACRDSANVVGDFGALDFATSNVDLAGADLRVDKTAHCASMFGGALTNAFGRIDGTVRAILPPGEMHCAKPNSTHLILQVDAQGETYRMVVNVESNTTGEVLLHEVDAPLAGPPFSAGWHAPGTLDYVNTLAAHSTSFVAMSRSALVAHITDTIALDSNVSVFATSSGGDSAHLVHRNVSGEDGAIVLRPTDSQAHWILLSFANQSF